MNTLKPVTVVALALLAGGAALFWSELILVTPRAGRSSGIPSSTADMPVSAVALKTS